MSSPPQRGFFKAQITLRVLAVLLASAAIVILLTSGEAATAGGVVIMQARYSYVPAFKFLFGADVVVCACSVLSLILVFLLSRPKSNPNNSYFVVFLWHDLVMALLMVAGCAAATAIGLVARDGFTRVGWMQICNYVGKFCNKMTLSVALSYLVFVCYLALTVVCTYKLLKSSRSTGTNHHESHEGI